MRLLNINSYTLPEMIVKIKWGLFMVCLGLALCFHAGADDTTALPVAPDARPSVTQSTDAGYILQPNDYIQVAIYNEDDLTTSTRLSEKGSIVLPLVNAIQVGGLTVADATTLIQDKYKDGYLRDPKVSLTIIAFAERRFSVLGQVQKPGTYEIPQQETVSILNAIALAGGFTETANTTAVSVRRNKEGEEEMFSIDAKEMSKESTHKPFNIEPGDVISVAEASKLLFSVLGQVQKPGSFEMQEETPVSILDAIAQAGGFTDTADPRAVSVKRNTGGKEEMFTIDAKEMSKESTHEPFIIQPGDVITVNLASKLFFSVLGQVQKPGSFEMEEETPVTILDAIAQAGGYTNIANPSHVNVRRKGNGAEEVYTIDAKEMAKDSTHKPFYVQPGDIITVSESLF